MNPPPPLCFEGREKKTNELVSVIIKTNKIKSADAVAVTLFIVKAHSTVSSLVILYIAGWLADHRCYITLLEFAASVRV